MNLANPAALWLLLLLLLLLLATNRDPRARLQVSTLHLWKAAAHAPTSTARRRLRRNPLALFVQAAFVVLVIAGVARPRLPVGENRIVVIVDLSASMGARQGDITRLDVAKSKMSSLIASLADGTRVHLIGAHAAPEDLGEFDVSAFDGAVRDLRVSDEAAAIETAVDRARILKPAAIYVFSDQSRPANGSASGPGILWTAVGQASDNLAITALTVGDRLEATTQADVSLSVRNFGTRIREATVVLEQDGALVRRERLILAPRHGAELVTTVRDAPGIVTARLEADDALAADNRRAAIIRDGDVRVRLLAASHFVRTALSAHPRVAIVSREPSDIVVCDGCSALPDADANVLIVPPRPEQIGEPMPLIFSSERHPLARALTLDGIPVSPIQGAIPNGDGREVIARAGIHAAVVAYTSGLRRVVELRFDPGLSALTMTPAFPVLMANAVEWLAARDRQRLAVIAGEGLTWVLPRETAPPIDVTGPDGQAVAATLSGGVLSVPFTRSAGVYRVRIGATERRFIVNPATGSESDLLQASADDEMSTANPTLATHQRELSGVLLLAALAVLAVESQRRYGRMDSRTR